DAPPLRRRGAGRRRRRDDGQQPPPRGQQYGHGGRPDGRGNRDPGQARRGLVGPLALPVPGASGGLVCPAGPPEVPAAARPGRAAAGPAASLSGTVERGRPRDADRGRRRQTREAAPDPPPVARPAAVVAPASGCLRGLAGDAVTALPYVPLQAWIGIPAPVQGFWAY